MPTLLMKLERYPEALVIDFLMVLARKLVVLIFIWWQCAVSQPHDAVKEGDIVTTMETT